MCPPNMLPCVHVSVLLARILTTPTLRFQQPYKSLGVGGLTAGQGLELYFPGIILCWVDNLQLQGFGPIPFHFGLYYLVWEEINNYHLSLSAIKETNQWHWGNQPNICGDSSSNCLSVCLSVCLGLPVSFLKLFNDSLP